MRRFLIPLLLALAALAPLAAAPAASAATKRPTITKVSPMRLSVGDRLTIRGRNFKSQRTRNTVIFRAPSGRSAFSPAHLLDSPNGDASNPRSGKISGDAAGGKRRTSVVPGVSDSI